MTDYTCECCKQAFHCDRTEEELRQEWKQQVESIAFDINEAVRVCDDCYKLLMIERKQVFESN